MSEHKLQEVEEDFGGLSEQQTLRSIKPSFILDYLTVSKCLHAKMRGRNPGIVMVSFISISSP